MEEKKRQTRDDYRFNLIAGIGIVILFMFLPLVVIYVVKVIPDAMRQAQDKDSELTILSRFIFSTRWFFLIAPILGFMFGLVALGCRNRIALVGCWGCVMITIASVLLINLGIDSPGERLLKLMSGS